MNQVKDLRLARQVVEELMGKITLSPSEDRGQNRKRRPIGRLFGIGGSGGWI